MNDGGGWRAMSGGVFRFAPRSETAPMRIRIEDRQEKDGRVDMKISGCIRACDVDVLSDVLKHYESRSVASYGIDLGFVESISLCALQEILIMRQRIEGRGAEFEFIDVSIPAEKMLRAMGAGDFLELRVRG